MGIKVYAKFEDENADYMMRRLKKICEKEGVIREMKEREYYEKKSDLQRRERIRRKKKSRMGNSAKWHFDMS